MWFVGVFSFIDYCRVWSTFPCVTQWILVTCFINSCCSVAQLCLTATPWTAACRLACPSLFPGVCSNSCPLSQWCHPTISPCHHLLLLPSIFPTIRVFSSKSALRIRWPENWSFSFSVSSSNEYSGLISVRMDWFDLIAVQGTLKSLLQHHSSKAPILQCSAFFIVQLSHPCMTSGNAIALTRWTFVGKVMSLFLICCLGWS